MLQGMIRPLLRALVVSSIVACGETPPAAAPRKPTAPSEASATTKPTEAESADLPRLAICEFSVCAIGSGGKVSCWGNDQQFGTLGPKCAWAREPTPVEDVPKSRTIACGSSQVCAAGDDGVTCWGEDMHEKTTKAPHRVTTSLEGPIHRLGASAKHACALDVKGNVACWGDETLLGGRGSGSNRRVGGVPPLKDLHVHGTSTWGCSDKGELWRWGTGWELFGIGVWDSPHVVPNGPKCETLGASDSLACAIDGSGQVACVGRGARGVSGEREEVMTNAPFAPPTGGPVRSVVVDGYKGCALRTDGGVVCWGKGANADAPTKPLEVAELKGAAEIAIGRLSTVCGRFADNRVRCAGERRTGGIDTATHDEVRLP